MWIWPIADENLVVHQGAGSLSEYQFGNKELTHSFCPKCGSAIMARRLKALPGEELYINARMLKSFDFEINSGKERFPGAARDPPYQPPPFPKHPDADNLLSGLKIYNGNCHCGAVTYAVKTKPLEEQKVLCCNCSLCSRNGDLWIYPPKSAVVVEGGQNLTDYAFLSKDSLHSFCKVCGVSVLVRVTDPKEDLMPINVRNIDKIDLSSLTLNKYDGAKNDPQYEV